jgi:hypothetical protein
MNKVEKLKAKISKLYEQIKEIQKVCPHTNVTKTARSNTGNWCKADDRYWYDCFCPDCQRVWDEDQ